MPSPGVTIETYLQKVKDKDIRVVQSQMEDLAKSVTKSAKSSSKSHDLERKSIQEVVNSYNTLGRAEAIRALKVKVATSQVGNLKEAFQAFNLIVRDSVTAAGFLNTALNIMISRFGSMLIVFGVYTGIKRLNESLKEATEVMDTSIRKVASLVVPTTTLGNATRVLASDMIKFAIEVGGMFEQLSDTQFLLASAGLKSAQIHTHFSNVQKLVIATAKDLNATLSENKKIVETVIGIYKNFQSTMKGFNSEQEKSLYLTAVIFDAYRRNQILLTELASGMTYAAGQARALGVSVEELIYLLAYSNTVMIKGSKAGTSMANAMRDVVRNAAHMRAAFGIDTTKIGKDFSFLHEVIGKVNEKIKETGITQKVFNDLTTGLGARGARTVIGLAPFYEELSDQINTSTDRIKELQNAVDLATESFKNQRQIQQNIKTIVANFFATAITGGHGYNEVLKNTNDTLRESIPIMAKMALGLGIISALVIQIGNLVLKLMQTIYRTRNVALQMGRVWKEVFSGNFDKARAQLDQLSDQFWGLNDPIKAWGESVKESTRGLQLLWDISEGRFEKYHEIVAKGKAGIEKQQQAVNDFAQSMSGMTKINNAFLKTLDTQYELFKDQGALWDELTEKPNYYIKKMEFLAFKTGEAFKIEDTSLFDKMDKFFARSEYIDNFFEKFTSGWTRQERDFKSFVNTINRQYQLMAQNVSREFREAYNIAKSGEGAESAGEVIAEFILKMESLFRDYYRDREAERAKFLDKELRDYKEAGSHLVQFFRNQFKSFPKIKDTGQDLFRAPLSVLSELKAADIEFDPDLVRGLRQQMESLTEQLTKDVGAAAEIRFQAKIDTQGLRRVVLNREFRTWMEQEFGKGFESIRDQIFEQYDALEEEAFDKFRVSMSRLNKLAENAGTTINNLISDSNLPEEQRKVEAFWNSLAGTDKEQIIAELVRRIKEIRTERDNMVSNLEDIGFSDLGILYQQIQTWFETLKKESEAAEIAVGIKMASIADSLDFAAQSFVNFADIISDEMDSAAQRIGNTFSTVLNMVANFTDLLHNYKMKMREIQDIGGQSILQLLSRVSFGFGIVGLVTGGIASIVNIFRDAKREKERLEQEFLPPDVSERLSPDYGQARVINQRISLNVPFNILEPSQLTEAVQRRIAQMVYEQIKELQKAGAA